MAIGFVLALLAGIVAPALVVARSPLVKMANAAVFKNGKHTASKHRTFRADPNGQANGGYFIITIESSDIKFDANTKVKSPCDHKDSKGILIGNWTVAGTPRASVDGTRLTVVFVAKDFKPPSVRLTDPGGTGTLVIMTSNSDTSVTDATAPIPVDPTELDPCNPT
jgi:hypothetical protein